MPPTPPKNICVWALNTNQIVSPNWEHKNFSDSIEVHIHNPSRGNNEYLHSRGGVFTELSGYVGNYYNTANKWPTLEDVFEGLESQDAIVICRRLKLNPVDRLRELLDREGINNAQLMPSLDNVSKTVIARW